MLAVINIERSIEEPVIGYDPAKVAIDEELNESYSLSMEITQNENSECFDLLQMENFLRLDENGQEYRIKTVNRAPRRNKITKSITANHVFFDIIGVKQDKSTALNGSKTFAVAMNYALSGTSWQWSLGEGSTFNALEMENFQGNALDLFNKLQERHSFEWYPDSSTKTVYIARQIGASTDAQIRYKYNMTTIKDNSNTNGLVNIRKGYGKKKEFASGEEPTVFQDSDYILVPTWRDQESINKYGERWGDDFENETITQEASMLEAIAADDKTKPFPEISLSMGYASLKEYGEDISIESTQLGNSVFVIHEPLAIDVQARILKRKYYPLSATKMPDLTIGSLKPSVVKQNVKARLAVIGTEKRLETNETAVSVAAVKVSEALAGVTTNAGDVSALTEAVAELKETLDRVDANVPWNLGSLLAELKTNADTTWNALMDTNGRLDPIAATYATVEQNVAVTWDLVQDHELKLASLQDQINELKGV